MKNLTFKAAMLNDSRTTVNRQSTDGQSQRHYKQTPLSKRWKVLMTLVFLFTFAIGQMWAVDPDYESYDWSSTAVNDVIGTHGAITISKAGLGANGNTSGHYYINLNQNLKNSDSSWKFFGISATNKIDSIEVLFCTNSQTNSETNLGWVAWGQGVTPNQYTLAHGVTGGITNKTKSWDNKTWEKIDLSSVNAYTVYLSRSVREFRETGGSSNLPKFGGEQTVNILGIRVWLHKHTVTLNLNGGSYASTPEGWTLSAGKYTKAVLDGSLALPEPAYYGNTFAGWKNKDNENVAFPIKVSKDTVLTAQWTPQGGTTHNITYTNTKGATNTNPDTYYEGTGVASFAVLADVTDFHFNGWSPASIAADATTDQTISATWVAAYNVTFSAGAGSGTVPASFQKWEGATFDLPDQGSMVAPSGKAFDGWKANGTGSTLDAGSEYTMGNAAVNFVAQWKAVPTTLYSLTVTNTSSVNLNNGGAQNDLSDDATIVGGGAYMQNDHASSAQQILGSTKLQFKAGTITLVMTLDNALQEGDTIKATGLNSEGLCFGVTFDRAGNLTNQLASDASYFLIPASFEGKTTLYAWRHSNSGTTCSSIIIRRPAQKDVKSTVYDLTAIKINGTAISAADLATVKTGEAYRLDLATEYPVGPTVKFARQTTITYDDDSQKVTNDTITVTATEVSSKWQAQATIGTITYTVNMAKVSAAKVYYYDGSTKLGEEIVAINGNPAEYAAKQSKNLATFVGWYSDADLAEGHKIANIAELVVDKDTTVYGKWTYTYAQSVNVEKWVLDNTKTPNETKTGNLISLLETRGFASNLAYVESNLELDSLNDGKGTGRNYAYLGLKVKVAGKMLDFRLAKDNTVKVKFGYVGTTPLLAINGGEYAAMTIEDGVFAYTATGEDYISIKTADAKAVVFQQIMIGENIQDVTLPEATRHAVVLNKAGETEHGTLAVASPETYNWLAENTAVTLTVAADDGYYIESVTLNGEALTPSENVYSFAMPNATANVVATFAEIVPNNVTYKANNGGEDADILAENATEIAGCSFTYAGHKFNGWNTAPDGTGNAYAEGDPVLSPLTLYAQWKEYFVITYMDGESVLDAEEVFVGETPVGIADPVKAMNIFQGWTLAGSDEVIDVTALTTATTVYAKWEAIDACFYFSAKSVDASTSIAVDEEIDNAYGGKVIAKTNNITFETLGVLVASSGSTYMKVELDYAMMEGTKISVKLAAGGTSTRGVNICYDANKDHKTAPMTWSAETAGEVKEFEYTLDSESALNGKKEFFIYRAANTYIQTIKVSNCAPQDYTVTYKDGESVLGTEQVFENEHPTADGINTHKKGYEFQGWAETVDGAVVDLNDITITAAKNLFAQYTVKDCSPMGVKFSMVPQLNELTSDYQLTGTTEQLIGEYAAVTGGVVYLNNNNSSNRVRITKTTSTIQLVSGDDGYIHVELDCPLKENDSIKFDNSERLVLAHNASKTNSVNIAKTDHFYIVPASWEDKEDIYIWRTGTGCTISGIEVVRPEIYAVSFNLMGHGSAIAPINVVKGSKITAPTAPEDDNYAFAGWYKENTLSNAWDFDNDVVAANTTLYAKWIDLSDATLKSLKYGAEVIALQAGVYEYNVELPALSTSVPALTAETSNPNATKEIANATEFDAEGHATSTVVVTPEKEGAATQTYTVNFSKAAAIELQDVTGNMTWDFSKDGLANNAAVGTEVVMANVEGVVNNDDFHSDNIMVTANKQAGTKLQASMIKFHTTVSGSVIVKCSNTGNNKPDRYLMVNGVETELHSTNQTVQTYAEYVPAGDVVLTVGGDGNMFNFTSVEFKLDNDLEPARTDDWLAPGEMGTICIPQGAVAVGADIYELVGSEPVYGKIVFETVKHMKPGKPYMFISKGDRIDLILTDENAASEPDNSGAMKGTFEQLYLNELENVYYFADHALWSCVDLTQLNVPANRAYVKLNEVEPIQNPTPAPGRVRMSLGVNGAPAVTTGVENALMDNAPVKMIINGQLFILRGEKMYDVQGQLVK